MRKRRIVILGSTGSIGTQTLDVVGRLNRAGHEFEVVGLAAGSNVGLLSEQIERFSPVVVSVAEEEGARALSERFPTLAVLSGRDGLERLACYPDVDLVVNALVGAIGLSPSLAALSCGRTLALANKESMVIGGELVTKLLRDKGGTILPIDSEHNAIFQSLRAGKHEEIERIIITASGGPFLNTPLEELASVSAQDALHHPNWAMGSRITIDSATMVNKAFEVIEAHHLFDVPYERIDPIVHPQSVIHSLVEYVDGSIIAELAASDMRIPIQYSLVYPQRIATDLPRLGLEELSKISFEPLDPVRYPAFVTVLAAGVRGGSAPAAVNAADEVLVKRFLRGEIGFTKIAHGLRLIFDRWEERDDTQSEKMSLARIMDIDRWAREQASAMSL